MPERAAEEAAHASETAVEALSHRLEELLESRPQSRNEVECLLQGAYWQGRFACRQRLLTRGCSGLVESVEERAQPKQQDEDLLGAILRRTQSSVKATAGRGAGGPSYASGAPPRPPALDEETAVDGLFDPVLLLRRQGERAAAAASATPPHVGGGRSGAACRDDGLDAELAERFMSTPAHVYERGGDGATDLTQFKRGFLKFKKEVIMLHAEHFRGLALAQTPKVMVIACCDSRVDPALLMGAGPGDIFTVRNIANLVPPFERQGSYHGTSAALEYAVRSLKVEHIVVMGHQHCGGIRQLMTRAAEATQKNDFIDSWMEIARSACDRTKLDAGKLPFAAQCAYCERESVNVSLANLLTFPWVKDAVARRALQLHGWYYDLEEASMSTWKLRYLISDYEKLGS